MNKLMSAKLEFLRSFQKNNPTAHVGGSIGLMLRGIDLKRDLTISDLDITIDDYQPKKEDGFKNRSDANDFDFSFLYEHENGKYTKVDIRITPEPSFEIVEYLGEKYNVSKLRDILFWKKKYADRGVDKHKYDIITIDTGKRPIELPVESDLPF